jgi:hypothetical protein
MPLQSIKTALASVWVSSVVVIGLIVRVESTTGLAMLATLALIPAIALLMLWKDPTPTLSESITKVLR